MSWDDPPALTQEMVTRKLMEVIQECLANNRPVSITDLGNIDGQVMDYWAEKVSAFAFKVLRHAKATALMRDQAKVDKVHIDIALYHLTKLFGTYSKKF